MKKALLTLVSLAMTLVSVAQSWTEPKLEISPSDYAQEFKTSVLSAEDGDSTFYYLYNIGAKGFLTQGNAPTHSQWGTNAILNESKGNLIMISKYELSETPKSDDKLKVGSSEPAEWDGKTYVINDLYGSKWYSVIITGEFGTFVDRADQIDYKWEIVSQGGGVYRIKPADVNPNFNAATFKFTPYFGWDELDEDYTKNGIKAITPAINLENPDEKPHVDWAFVEVGVIDLYNARVVLYETLNKAVETGVDYSAASAVYNNTSATIAEIEAATAALKEAIYNKAFEDATEENPLDVTDWIVNASFDAGNASGWNVGFIGNPKDNPDANANNVGYQGNKDYTNGEVKISKFIEAWANEVFNKNYDFRAIGVGELTQTIKNMPAGKYKLAVDCIAVQQDGKADPVIGVELFATGGEIDIFTNISTGNEKPEHFEITFVNNGSEIKLGLRTTEKCNANWIAADNFKLMYCGPITEDPYKVILDETVNRALASYPLEGLDKLVAYTGDKEAFKTTIAEAQAATEGYQSLIASVNNAVKALDASVAAYEAYIAETERIEEYIAQKPPRENDYTFYLSDYFSIDPLGPDEVPENGNKAYILENLKLNTEAIIAETDTLGKILMLAIVSGLEPGDDCSDMLVNASFADGFNGWVNNCKGKYANGAVGNFSQFDLPNNVELYEGTVDCYQIVNNVPDGVYALTLKAFERPADNGYYNGMEPSKVFLYMNELETPVQNILTDALPDDEAEDGVNCYKTNKYNLPDPQGMTDYESDKGWVPNGMVGAAVAFNAGRYKQTVYGLVEGGTMKIGITSKGANAHWVLWSDFKLTYMGTEAKNLILEARMEALETAIENTQEYAEENNNVMTSPAVDELDEAIEAAGGVLDEADEALAGGDPEELDKAIKAVEAAISDLQAAIETANKNIAALKACQDARDELGDAVENSDLTTSQEALNNAADLLENEADDDTLYELTTDELGTLTERIKDALGALKVPADIVASDEKPFDMTGVITNADFEESAESAIGWSWRTDNGYLAPGMLGSDPNNPALPLNGSYSAEAWNGDAKNVKLDLYQELRALPAGTYELKAKAANSLNGEKDNGNSGRLFIYAATYKADSEPTYYSSDAVELGEEQCSEIDTTYSVIFTLEEGEIAKVGAKTSGVMSARWIAVDDFELWYYGTESTKEDSGDPSGVEAIEAAGAEIVAIYTVSGARVATLQKGINIVKYADGTTKKVIVQ